MRFAAALILLPVLSLPAHAALHVCNHTKAAARVAVGRFDGVRWISEGWWSLAPTKCDVVVPGTLKARYYYLYATDGGAGAWGGSRKFCVDATKDKFVSNDRGRCAAEGMDSRGFFAVDTGSAPDYTQSLSD
ncbi:MAG TPA: DUF1036 domain-containing protein [Rhizomicrobium sp.]|nr:DUF1036 domain-containing protein [Rhizomicrobium sp.]